MCTLITVCITTYNRCEFLKKAVSSVQKQTYKNFEIVIVDDASTDNTQGIINTIMPSEKGITYFAHSENKGLAAARNTAIFNAKGRYFTFLDDDDEWEPEFLEKFHDLAEQYNSDYCFCCGSKTTDQLGRTVYSKYALDGLLLDYIKTGYTPPVAAQFYFTKSLLKVSGYNESIKSGVDHDLWLKLAFAGYKIKSLDDYLSVPNTNSSLDRMTTNYYKRLNGIENSLKIWKNDIVKRLGLPFYLDFKNKYLLREKKKFLRQFILTYSFANAFNIYADIKRDIRFKYLLKLVLLMFLRLFRINLRSTVYQEINGILK
jgi:glycosyltransferase involved in cell wall biosynthesis